MANSETLGASFSIDVTDLKTGLAQANRMIRESESEFKAAAAGMDDWRDSQEGVTAKIKSLTDITDIQKKKVNALQSEYDRLIEEGLEPTSKEATELRTKINNETTALKKNEAQLKKLVDTQVDGAEKGKSLKKIVSGQEKEVKKLEKQYKKATKAKNYDADAARELKEELEELKKELGENKEALGDVKKEAEETGKSFEGLGSIAGGAFAAMGAAITGAVTAFFGLAEGTREARNNMAKLETSFEQAGHTTAAAEMTFSNLYGIMGDDGAATEAAQHLAKFSSNAAELQLNTKILTGVMAEYGDSIPLEGLAEGMAATAAMGSVQGALADALEWQGINLDDYNAKLESMTTEEERASYIQRTLIGLYGDSADAYMKNNAAIIEANKAQAEMNDALNELGAIAEPIMTTLKKLATDLLVTITPFVSLIGEGLAGAFAGADGAADSLAEGVSGLITTALNKVVEIAPFVIQTILALFPTLLSSILGQLPFILETLLTMVTQIAAELTTMLPALIPVIIDAVMMLADTAIDNIDMLIDAGIELLLALADGLIEALPQLVEKIPVIIEKLIAAITRNLPKILEAGVTILLKISEGLVQAIPQLLEQIPLLIGKMVRALLEGIPELVKAGADLLAGLFKGLLNPANILNGVKSLFNGIVGGIKDIFGIHSPSKVMADEVGKNLALGIGEGFEKNIAGVNKQIAGAMDFSGTSGQVGVAGRGGGGVVVQQTNYYSQAHSRLELYKTKQNTAAAVRLAMAGA